MLLSYFDLCFRILYWALAAPFQGKPFSLQETFRQMVRIGVEAIPMSSLTALSIGITLALQSATEMAKFGAQAFVPDLVAVSLLRELGPMLVAVIVIGRSGSAVTAELGTMKVSEEIEALQVMAINPVRFLVIPRVIAMMVMLPVITIIGDLVGNFGGWLICNLTFGMSSEVYILHAIERASLWDLYSGLIKSVVFAWIIISIACHAGLSVTGGAEGVGRATTQSVVYSLLTMLISDTIMTALFYVAI
jgi:phospholipid/cholesterol/gamma-HCH transport system permease protein